MIGDVLLLLNSVLCIYNKLSKIIFIAARFWYENPSTFSPAKLTQIKQASLAKVLCDNGDNITLISKDVFKLPELQSPKLLPCKSIPNIDLRLWFECNGGEWSEVPVMVYTISHNNRDFCDYYTF